MNPKNLTKHTVLLHKLGSNPTTPKLVNIIRCKKGQATFHVLLAHKTMAKAIIKGCKLLMELFHQIQVNTMASQENILDKLLD
jgi:hypothetical protein